jgi:putative SOS response-associated peptidase YedK
MCARHTLAAEKEIISKEYPKEWLGNYQPNWNIAITDESQIITADKSNLIQPMHFGIIPWTSKTGKMEGDWFNAKSENLTTSKLWKPLFEQHKRCLVLSDGFYEWKKIDNGGPKPDKEPYRFVLKDRPVYAYAGLWSQWVNPKTKEAYRTYSVITTESNELVGEIHDKKRMPVILSKANEELWLAKDIAPKELIDLCVPYPDELMVRFRVSKRINSVNRKTAPNNDAALILPENSK